LGALVGSVILVIFPEAHVDVRIAALIGMAAIFAGASRALLTSIIFAFEVTLEPLSLLPLVAGCTTSYLVSSLFMKQSIMTEKIARRGIHVPNEYSADFLASMKIKNHASDNVVWLKADDSIGQIRDWLVSGKHGSKHQGFPVLDQNQRLVGVVTRRDVFEYKASRHLFSLILNFQYSP
jgi:CBS domain-containing protein